MTHAPSAADRNDRWMWHELPSAAFTLAMNVRLYPCLAAISLAPVL
jgi:hypothetical protein